MVMSLPRTKRPLLGSFNPFIFTSVLTNTTASLGSYNIKKSYTGHKDWYPQHNVIHGHTHGRERGHFCTTWLPPAAPVLRVGPVARAPPVEVLPNCQLDQQSHEDKRRTLHDIHANVQTPNNVFFHVYDSCMTYDVSHTLQFFYGSVLGSSASGSSASGSSVSSVFGSSGFGSSVFGSSASGSSVSGSSVFGSSASGSSVSGSSVFGSSASGSSGFGAVFGFCSCIRSW